MGTVTLCALFLKKKGGGARSSNDGEELKASTKFSLTSLEDQKKNEQGNNFVSMCFSVLYCEIPKTSQHLENCSRPSFYNSKKLDQARGTGQDQIG